MATTPKGIYYPNDYNEIADIPEDMKKMAESIDGVFENTDSDLSDIKEEQTTQNNRLNSLEVDNTTNKSDILTNKQEINNIKTEQTEQNTNISTNATNIESLQEENESLKKIVSQLPQVEGQGTSITLENTIEAQFTKFDVEGNSTQESTKGDNIISSENIDVTYMGVKYLSQNNGTILANGTKYGGAYLNLTNNIVNLENDTYSSKIFLLNGSISRDGTNIRPTVYLINQADTTKSYNIGEIGNPGKSQLIEAGTYYLRIATWQDNTIFANSEIGIMLVKGSTIPTDFEKFTNGASPNPNYEQPILSSGDNENLLPANNGSETINGVIFTKKSDGTILANGTATAGINYYINGLDYENIPVGEYTLSDGVGVSGGESSNTFFTFLDDAPNSNSTISLPTFTLSQATNLRARIVIRSGVTLNNVVFKPKLEKGNKASGYSPYGMGSINEKIINGNIFDEIMEQGAYSGSDGTTLISSPKYIRSKNYTNVVAGETYIITIKAKGTNQTNGNIFIYNIDETLISTISGLLNSFTIPTGGRKIKINVFNNNNIAPSDVEFAMMNIGSIATSYVPHEEQDYSIFVQQPMRSIGDVRDLFFKNVKGSKYYNKDLEENKWYERHYINRKIFDGTENWVYSYNNFVLARQSVNTHLANSECISNNYIYSSTALSGDYGIRTGNADFIQIRDTNYDNVTDFQAMLSEKYANGTPIYVDYLLAEPLDLPCTPEQIQQLENKPSTYKDFTIIQSEDETEAYLEVSGIYDLNKLITRTEVLESEV